jgi:hypothetical protein
MIFPNATSMEDVAFPKNQEIMGTDRGGPCLLGGYTQSFPFEVYAWTLNYCPQQQSELMAANNII